MTSSNAALCRRSIADCASKGPLDVLPGDVNAAAGTVEHGRRCGYRARHGHQLPGRVPGSSKIYKLDSPRYI
jgi:predicted small lipoprotein YifL